MILSHVALGTSDDLASVSPRITAPHSQVICFAIESSFDSDGPVVAPRTWDYVGAELARARVQLCGRFVVELDGRRVEDELPGRQGRLAFAYLVCARNRSVTRDELLEALWPDGRDAGL